MAWGLQALCEQSCQADHRRAWSHHKTDQASLSITTAALYAVERPHPVLRAPFYRCQQLATDTGCGKGNCGPGNPAIRSAQESSWPESLLDGSWHDSRSLNHITTWFRSMGSRFGKSLMPSWLKASCTCIIVLSSHGQPEPVHWSEQYLLTWLRWSSISSVNLFSRSLHIDRPWQSRSAHALSSERTCCCSWYQHQIFRWTRAPLRLIPETITMLLIG